MPKLLAKQHLNIRLIVDHENEEIHAYAPLASNTHSYLKWKNL